MDFNASEYEARLAMIQDDMAELEIDAMILTNERNIRYLTGYHNQGWVSPTRARYVVVPSRDQPIAVIPTTNVIGFRELSWVTDIRHWSNPVGVEGAVLVHDAATRAGAVHIRRIAIESGPESRWQATIEELSTLRALFGAVEFVDAQQIVARSRRIKSAAEVAIMRHVARHVTSTLDDIALLHAAGNEEDVYFALLGAFQAQRIERTPYLVVTSGRGGYDQINTGPLKRRLEPQSIMCVDTGCSHKAYFCDVTRNYSFGKPDSVIQLIYRQLFEATEAGMDAARPGARCCDVWARIAEVLGTSSLSTPVGRFGHGVGMDITEGPSIAASDTTVLLPGMAIAIEPSIVFERDGERKIMVQEENLVITEKGSQLLTKRTPQAIIAIERGSV